MKKQRHHFADKGLNSQSYGFSYSHVWIWELNHKEGRVPKNWCFWTVVLEKTLESPLKSKEIILSILKEISSEYSLEGLMLKRKLQYIGHLMWRADSLGKTDAGKDWREKEKGAAEDEMVRWHHQLNGHEFYKVWEIVKDREAWSATVHGLTMSQTWLSNWKTETPRG